jgi:hypothetical protein
MSELLWISVPGGVDAGRPLLRVLVVPRLEGPDLQQAGMAHWPPAGLLEAPVLTLEWRASEETDAVANPVPGNDVTFEATPGLWERFFAADLPLGERRTAPSGKAEVRATSTQATAIDETFRGAAGVAFAAEPDAATPQAYLVEVERGLEPWAGQDEAPAPPLADAPTPVPPQGFHRIVSLLREHPAVLRALGLIFDLRVTPPTGLADAGQVRVLWPAAPTGASAPTIVSPWTQYGRAFFPFSKTGNYVVGMVALTPDPAFPSPDRNGRWKVVTVDVEGGVRKLLDAAQTVGEGGAPASLPAMRTAGIQLVHVGRQDELDRRRDVAVANDARGTLDGHVLFADDLVLGYRIDIKRGGGDWRSLHERIATYNRGDPDDVIGEPQHLEEGHVKAAAAVREADGALRASEVVARWNGWSLALPRPPFDAPGGRSRSERRAAPPIEFGWTFEPKPASLPILRFAETYAVRARVADMAGGGLKHDDPAADRCAITEQAYRRYEPVPSPALLLETGVEVKDLGPGEAVDRIVVRSAPDVAVDAFDQHNPGYSTHARRALHRPRTSLAIAEQHRMLDHDDDEQTFVWVQRALAAADPARRSEPGDGPLPDPAAGGVSVVARREPGAPRAAFARRDWAERWPEPSQPKVVELRGPSPGKPPLTWEDDRLVVRLAPADQITLELSSSLTADFRDHFELQDVMPTSSKRAAEAGRHPLITPPHAITFVHAVRKPINPPDPAAKLTPRPRDPGQTFALLDPEPVLLGLHANSTAQLDVTAAWTERRDDAIEQIEGSSVHSFVISRGDEAFKEPVHHEFGDTRHRDVTYTLTAIGRFRPFFKPEEVAADPAAFAERRTLALPVSIPNTARPAAPVVLATRPAFAWEESVERNAGETTLRRHRHGGRLRVELARPWYVTGDGERLGVMLWDHTGGVVPPPELAGLITEVGRDPIWDTPTPERWPTDSAFSGTAGPPDSRVLTEAGRAVLVVPYEPWFHADRWYADVALPGLASASYCPFVRLALARYQPDSIDGHHVSPVVCADLTQVLPDRTLTITQAGATIRVALAGIGPVAPQGNRVDLVLEHCQLPAGVDAGAVELTRLSAGDPGAPAWAALPGPTPQTTVNATPVTLQVPSGVGAVRLRLREVELVGAETPPASQVTTSGELTERVVFTDTVLLPLA